MIKIDKDSYPPDVRFIGGGIMKNKQLRWRFFERSTIKSFLENPIPFNEGKHEFSSGFGYDEFRNALRKCQGSKCCFCEKPIDGGAIEHFRPKAGWKQNNGSPLQRPGYYWLAYRWSNMLLACPECNSQNRKGNLFPISGVRATTHTMNCNDEEPVLINPTTEDPSTHITFLGSVPIHIDARGLTNISIFDLDKRSDLIDSRKDKFDLYKTQKDIANLNFPFGPFTLQRITEAKRFIAKAKSKKAPFAGMINENIKNGNL